MAAPSPKYLHSVDLEQDGATVVSLKAPSNSDSLTSYVLGLEWSKHFPMPLANGRATFEVSTFDECMAFAAKHFPEIYHAEKTNAEFLDGESSAAKERFYRRNGDFFLVRCEGKPVGIFLGALLDWSSYNVRNVSILPDYQGQGLYQELFVKFMAVLKIYGVDRVEGDIAPTNVTHLRAVQNIGFVVTGLNLSERWGSLLHVTCFLSEKHEGVFHKQFCHVVQKLRHKAS